MQVAIPMFIVLTLGTVPTYYWLSDVRIRNDHHAAVSNPSIHEGGGHEDTIGCCIEGWVLSGKNRLYWTPDWLYVLLGRYFGCLLRRCGLGISPL